MSHDVAGEEEGVRLLDAINAGRIPRPAEMSFPRWQAWRRGEGRRPTARRDGRGLTTAEEVEIRRSVMAHLYGDERFAELERDSDDEAGSPQGAMVAQDFPSPPQSERPAVSPAPSLAGLAAASVLACVPKSRLCIIQTKSIWESTCFGWVGSSRPCRF